MVAPINLNTPVIPTNQVLQETTLRRQLTAELASIQDYINRSGMQDALTGQISHWRQQFSVALRLNVDPQRVFDEFGSLLQDIMRDPLLNAPFDEESVIGKHDGHAYGRKSLSLWLNSVPDHLRRRSPLETQNETVFVTEPHHVVRYVVEWMRNRNILLKPDEIEQAYNILQQQNRLPIIPTAETERIRCIRERQQQINQQRNQQFAEGENQIRNVAQNISQEVQNQFAPILAQIQQNAEQHHARLNRLEQRDQEQLAALGQAAERLNQEAEALEGETQELQNRISRVGNAISDAERDNLKLKVAINQTRIAVANMKKNRFKKIIMTVAIIGACAFATWALQAALTAAGSSASASLTAVKGGAKIGISFPFFLKN